VQVPEQPALFDEPTLSVSALSEGIGRALARAFPDEVWVRGEIANLSRTGWGHVYFDLVEDESSLRVVLWDTDRRVVNQVLKRAGGAVRMTDGTDVRVRVRVGWFPKRGTVSLRMLSIDPAYTLGQLAEAKERLLATLRADGTLGRNAALPMPLVPLHVGLVTSEGSAAAADFLRTLEASGRGFAVTLVDARVQGLDAERSIVGALRTLAARSLDVVCVVRGGGARTDLAAFDREAVVRAIAAMPAPVLTGIGHEVDVSVADHAAHRAFKTPTACAQSLVERVQAFSDRCANGWERIERAAGVALDRSARHLERSAGQAVAHARQHVRNQQGRIDRGAIELARRAPRALASAERVLAVAASRAHAVDPSRALARGWTITRRSDGQLVRSASEVVSGDVLVTTFADGRVSSRAEAGDG
jgi:exodeoxyribonuclease VII large subunit